MPIKDAAALAALSRAIQAAGPPATPAGLDSSKKRKRPKASAPELLESPVTKMLRRLSGQGGASPGAATPAAKTPSAAKKKASKPPAVSAAAAEAAVAAPSASEEDVPPTQPPRKKKKRKDKDAAGDESCVTAEQERRSQEGGPAAPEAVEGLPAAQQTKERKKKGKKSKVGGAEAVVEPPPDTEVEEGGQQLAEEPAADEVAAGAGGRSGPDVSFRELYVGAVTDAIEAELSLQAAEADGRGVSVGALLHCLDLGVDLFSPLQQRLSAQSMRQQKAQEGRPLGRGKGTQSAPPCYQELFGWL